MQRILLFATLLVFLLAGTSKAQDAAEESQPYWYVSYYTVDWSKTDSLTKLWEMTKPVRERAKQDGEILEWIGLIHDTGNEHNVVMMTKYPSWSAMRAPNEAFQEVFPNAAERARIGEGYNWVFGAGAHQDGIYTESPGSLLPSSDDDAEGAYWYATFYDIPFSRVDSLQALWEATAEVPAEAHRNGSILGTLGLVHHSGMGISVITMSKFPSWDALEDRSWGGAFRAVMPDDERRAELNAGFGYVFQGAPHYDVIYVQPTR
jgi:hypothetical protein